jgi:molybdopterin synthase catalytic subunit
MSAPAEVRIEAPERGVAGVYVGARTPDLTELRATVADPRAGAIILFEGITREVDALEYEAYAQMAAEQILEIAARAVDELDACVAAVHHVVGTVALSQPSVIIAISAPHRGQAFDAARRVLDELKQLAPIWKVERSGEERHRVAGVVPQPPRADDVAT